MKAQRHNHKTVWRIVVWLLIMTLAWLPFVGHAAEELASLWTAFTVEDGLRSGNIRSILVAQDGTLWFGTDAGVGHYDGSWRWMTAVDGLPAGKVHAIAQTADGALWFATSAGLARLAPPNSPCCTVWTSARGLPSDDVLSLAAVPPAADGNGQPGVWAGTTRGLVFVTPQRVEKAEKAIPALGISALALTTDGKLLAGVQGQGIWQRDLDGRWQELDGTELLKGDIYALLPEADGVLWAGTANGLLLRRPGAKWNRFPLAEGTRIPPVFAVLRDPYGGLWAATDQGIYHDPDATADGLPVAHIRAGRGGLVNDYVRALALDHDNALWLGTIGGINRYAGIIWHVVTDSPLYGERVNAVVADRAGRIWVATENNGLVLRDGTRWRHLTAPADLPDNRAVTLFEDDRGRVWIATGTAVGLLAQNEATWRFEPLDTRGLIGLPVFAFAQDNRGSLWLGGEQGAARWTEQEGIQRVVELEGQRVNAIHQARNGVLWFGTRTDGLIRRVNGQWQALAGGPGGVQVNDVVVNGIVETDDGSLWVGTYNDGLWRLRDNVWERSDMNLASPKVLALYAQRGDLWVGTRQGLSRFDGLTWQSYRGDALPAPWVTALTVEQDGTVWIGTTAGLVQYRPERTRPRVEIETVNLEEPHQGRITLKDNTLRIIRLRGGDLATRAGDLLYLTQIQGLENAPRVHTAPQITAYGNLTLAPGTYVLQVMARDAAFNYSRPVELSITVPRMVLLPGGYEIRASLLYPLLALGMLALTGLGVSSGIGLRARARARRLAAEKAQRQREALARGFNPYISGEPVREPDMFFGRDELLQRIFNALHQNSIMIHGERRMGKTTLLYQLAELLRQADDPEWVFVPVYIDLEGTPEPRFFHQLMEAIWGALQSYLQGEVTPSLRFQTAIPESYSDRDFAADLRNLLKEIKSTVAPRTLRVILLMDEMDVVSSYSTMTQQQLRRILVSSLAVNLGAVVAGVHISKEWDRLESPWYNLFNEIALEPFTPDEARALLTEPVRGIYDWEPDAIQAVIRRAGGRPHRLQQYALEAVNRMLAAGRLRIALADVEAAHEIIERSYGP